MTRAKETGPLSQGPAPTSSSTINQGNINTVNGLRAMTPQEARDLAQKLARAGVPVFPIGLSWNHEKQAIDKEPLTTHGFKDASTDSETVETLFLKARLGPGQYWGVGAYLGPAGYIVLDVDTKNGGTGLEDLARLTKELGPLPASMKVTTASGGFHLYFRRPDKPAVIGNGKLAPGIDVRCDNGYVVAPGTTSPWRDWTRGLESLRLADISQLPDAWAARLNGRGPSGDKQPIPDMLTPGSRHDALVSMAGAMRRRGGTATEILAALKVMNSDRCDPPHSDKKLKEIAADIAARYAPEPDTKLVLASSNEPNPESTWRPVDLAAFLAGGHTEDRPSVLRRSDGVALLYRGRVHSLYGEPESLKTWAAVEACRQEIDAGNTVAYIDFEDSVAGIIARLRNLGISDEVIATKFIYIRPAERITPTAWEGIVPALSTATLTVIDGTTEAMVMEGLNLLDNSDVATFFERLPRSVARLGPAVLNLDHVGRNKENRGRFAIGAQAKLAGIDGAAYSISLTKPFGRGKIGQADIRLTKDRVGYVSEHVEDEHRTIASVEAISDTETVTITLNSPGEFVPTVLMEKVADAIQATPGISQKQIRDSVSGKDEWKRKALHQLVARGYVTTEPGARGAILHTLKHPYRDGDQLRPYDLFPPVPHLFPEQVKVSFSPVPTHSVGTGEGLSENKTYSEESGNRSRDRCPDCGGSGMHAAWCPTWKLREASIEEVSP